MEPGGLIRRIHVGEHAHHGVGLAAKIAGEQAEDDADRHPDRAGDQADDQGLWRRQDQDGQDIAPLGVRAQPMLDGWGQFGGEGAYFGPCGIDEQRPNEAKEKNGNQDDDATQQIGG